MIRFIICAIPLLVAASEIVAQEQIAEEKPLTWIDVSGKYKIEAKFLRIEGDMVVLERTSDKEEVAVSFDKLSRESLIQLVKISSEKNSSPDGDSGESTQGDSSRDETDIDNDSTSKPISATPKKENANPFGGGKPKLHSLREIDSFVAKLVGDKDVPNLTRVQVQKSQQEIKQKVRDFVEGKKFVMRFVIKDVYLAGGGTYFARGEYEHWSKEQAIPIKINGFTKKDIESIARGDVLVLQAEVQLDTGRYDGIDYDAKGYYVDDLRVLRGWWKISTLGGQWSLEKSQQ